MPNIFNTVNSNIKFFNFISNSFPSGVPVSQLYSYSSNANFHNWLKNVAMPGQVFWDGSWQTYIRFPYNASEPALATETLLSNSTLNSTNYRFRLQYLHPTTNNTQAGDSRTINSGNSRRIAMNTRDVGAATDTAELFQISLNNDGDLSTINNYFSFGVVSPTTVVMTTIVSNLGLGSTLDLNFSSSVTAVMGWMHDPIYTVPLPLETQRYYSCYSGFIYHAGASSLSPSSFDFRGVGDKGLGQYYGLGLKYYDITLQNGTYTPGLFVTDWVFIDGNFVKRGKADNRVLALGRGNFKLGQIYQITDPFGRVGTEEWLCISSLTPGSYNSKTWTPTSIGSNEDFRFWSPNELDYLLMRVYTEAD